MSIFLMKQFIKTSYLFFYSFIQWSLVCNKMNYPFLSQSVTFVGVLVGAYVWGMAADKIGRRKVFFISSALVSAFGVCSALSFGFFSFTFCRLCVGVNLSGIILSSYVLSLELVGKSARKLVGIVGSFVFGLAYPILAVLAYYIRNWRLLTLVVSLGFVVIFALYK